MEGLDRYLTNEPMTNDTNDGFCRQPNFKLTTDSIDLVINHTKNNTIFSLDVCLNEGDSFNLAQLIIDFLKENCESTNKDILTRKQEYELRNKNPKQRISNNE